MSAATPIRFQQPCVQFRWARGPSAGWGWAVGLARRLSVDLCGCARSSAGGMIIHCRPSSQRAADRIARTSSSDAWAPLRDDSEGPGIEHVGPQICGDSATGATRAAFAGMVRHSFFRSHFGSTQHEARSKRLAQVRPLRQAGGSWVHAAFRRCVPQS